MFGAVAQFELDLIRERTQAAIREETKVVIVARSDSSSVATTSHCDSSSDLLLLLAIGSIENQSFCELFGCEKIHWNVYVFVEQTVASSLETLEKEELLTVTKSRHCVS